MEQLDPNGNNTRGRPKGQLLSHKMANWLSKIKYIKANKRNTQLQTNNYTNKLPQKNSLGTVSENNLGDFDFTQLQSSPLTSAEV
ncbi:MAG: hypothetical protein JAY75_01010 [Candidatus Thiodiazotropha taylori]|nr:hypothetical protein [Candidatus Thiodiazotropha taylori]MCG8074807.1 hypothetical protein [Candidatus Thiodiazotropha taylori]MCW4306783.1 hypothetical protein [Candidatus Thiodiazotropha endolucinida]MCW4336876.1 hypothetical protein [Candidatus Thiodiazotropha endolucinida]